ncbi:MAG: hypothetical protein ACI9W6_002843 [Motiliproteus sp.]|jgi:hypothetical protein
MLTKLRFTLALAPSIALTIALITALALLPAESNANPDTDDSIPLTTLEWTDLIPQGFDPNDLIEEYQQKYNIDELPDDDLRVEELMQKLTALDELAPVNTALNGILVKMPGYVVPIETDGTSASKFLLVPYFGACIHVPPPPLNQTVYVSMQEGNRAEIRGAFDVVWVTGMMRVETLSTGLADAGYVIDAMEVEPYDVTDVVEPDVR